ncbi:hypothetical protein Ancab_002058 [Ancistrocladus abbreviatus]
MYINAAVSVENHMFQLSSGGFFYLQSEDGDIIDCVDIYKQPAFNHPALRNHRIQMTPSYNQITKADSITDQSKNKKDCTRTVTFQLWQRNGSCPIGTVPIRRIREEDLLKATTIEGYGRKNPSFSHRLGKSNEDEDWYMQKNHSVAILHTEGHNYWGAKADIKVWNPYVEHNDEYSTSRISVQNGSADDYEDVESGWVVNPSVYGDKETRFYTYWTVDGSKTTGCFDLTCPGFIQTSNEIALGGVIKAIPVPGGLPWIMTLYIFKDPETANWWVQYQERINIGYWPAELFTGLTLTGETVQWGGEVYSPRLGHTPHTGTAMGSGQYPHGAAQDSGWTKRMQIQDNSLILKFPELVYPYTDEYRCYDFFYFHEYIDEAEFYFGGPGRSYKCP